MDAFCGKASVFSKLTLILLFPALGIQCAGLGTIAWMKDKTSSHSADVLLGLWKMANCSGNYFTPCVESALPSNYETANHLGEFTAAVANCLDADEISCNSVSDMDINGLLTLTQALECTSLVFIVISLALSALYVTSPHTRIQKTAVSILTFCLTALAFIVGGAIVWVINLPDKHYAYWSMGLTLVTAALCLLCSILMIPDIRNYDYEGVERKAAERREKKRMKQKDKDTAMLI